MMGMGEGFLPGFLLSLAAGVALGAFYASLRVLRIVLGGGRRRQFFTDLLFMTVAAPVTFLVALAAEAGQLRFYILAGEGIGLCLWALTFGELTGWAAQLVIRGLSRLKRGLKRIFWPVGKWFRQKSGQIWRKISGKRKNKLSKPKKSLETKGESSV